MKSYEYKRNQDYHVCLGTIVCRVANASLAKLYRIQYSLLPLLKNKTSDADEIAFNKAVNSFMEISVR